MNLKPASVLFRENSEKRIRLVELFQDDVLQEAIAIVQSEDIGKDALIDAPEVVSVRVLSQRAGCENGFVRLQELTLPIPETPIAPPETFGTKHTIDEFDQPTGT